MKLTRTRVWYVIITLTTIILGASLPALDAHASTIANSNEGLALSAGQLSVGSVVNGALSGVVNSSIQGTYPQATWTDTTGSGSGWQGSIAVTTAVYTGTWAAQGSAPSLASTSAGGYTGTTDGLQITVSVGSGGSSTSTPFTWTDNNGGSGSGSATNGTAVAVEDGITISFASGTTYPSGAQYMVDTGAQSTSSLELLSSSASVAATSGTISPAPTLVNSTAAVVAGGAATYGTSVSFVSSVTDTGMGSYTIAPGVDVVVDSSSWAATYTAQAQYTIASGPGSAPTTASSGSTSFSGSSTQQAAVTTDNYTGSAQTYTVPSGVSLVQMTVDGAAGAAAGDAGGNGGKVVSYLPVSPGETLYVYVGIPGPNNFGAGGAGGVGYYGGAGSSSLNGGNGGNSTSIYTSSTALAVIAGGGGGGGTDGGGGGGGNPDGSYGGGGSGGGGATQSAGGAGGYQGTCAASNDYGNPGSFGLGGGGAGINVSCVWYGSGGGGGGYYGGGGGIAGGGGGGGSSWAASFAQDVSYTIGSNTGNGSVSIQPLGALPPTNLTANYDVSTTDVVLSWVDSTSSNVTGYDIYRDGSLLTQVGPTVAGYTDTTAPQSTTVTYGVQALTSGLPSTTTSVSVITEIYSQQVITDGAVGYWQLNDTTTTAVDSSGNNNNGTYTGTYTQGVSGPLLSSPSTNATSFSNGWVSFPNSMLINTTETLEAWFKTTSDGVIFGEQNGPAGGTSYYNYVPDIYIGTNGLLYAEVWTGTYNPPINSSSAVNNGDWQFVALVVTPSSESLYLNGALIATTSSGAMCTTTATNECSLAYNQIGWGYAPGWAGAGGNGGAFPFVGTIGQADIIDAALTQQQITNQYAYAGY